jgi:hypothetical protein
MIWRWLKVAALGAALVLTGVPMVEPWHFGAGQLEITAGIPSAEAR